jgi:hypothetical protein
MKPEVKLLKSKKQKGGYKMWGNTRKFI